MKANCKNHLYFFKTLYIDIFLTNNYGQIVLLSFSYISITLFTVHTVLYVTTCTLNAVLNISNHTVKS